MHFHGHCGPRGHRHGGRWEGFAREVAEAVGGEWGRGRRGGFGRMRVLDAAGLRLVLLKLIAEEPRHGYDIIKAIETLSGGLYAPSPGMVYPTLTLLADEGLADEIPDGSRKRFAITDAGRAVLAAEEGAVETAMARLAELGRYVAPTDAPEIRRALRNLQAAINNRLGEGQDRGATLGVAALIDEAAGRIERL
ncbi:hypothetical protein IP88_11015 [alpha proteobacterium AAP81b]|nr:hypothetical protein IP88_11015 [alpha proteobacterium AAP81b]